MDDAEMRSPLKSPPGNGTQQYNSPTFYARDRRRGSPERSLDNISDENEPPAEMTTSFNDQERVNPFEKDQLEGLQKSFWSPSVMEITATPPQRSWAIEHLSHLFPKDIENSPTTHQNAFPVDEQMEAKAQADITKFFNRGQIAPTPSPMKSTGSQAMRSVEFTKISRTSYTQFSSPITRGGGLGGGNSGLAIEVGLNKKKVTTEDRYTQTGLNLRDLPPHLEKLLSEYMLEDSETCGSFTEKIMYPSQKSKVSEHADIDIADNDSGKNSSSLNNSIRRRLDLSFGDDPDGDDSNGPPPPTASPIPDPFRCNHLLSTPPSIVGTCVTGINTTTSELEVQFMRCEFTPETKGLNTVATPGITPITDEPDEKRFENFSSTPKRGASGNVKRLTGNSTECPGPISHLAEYASAGSTNSNTAGVSKEGRINLRRSHSRAGNLEVPSRKLSAASSFDDSQFLMDESSPPAKLSRRHSDKPNS